MSGFQHTFVRRMATVSSQSMKEEALGSAQAPRAIVVFCDKLAKHRGFRLTPEAQPFRYILLSIDAEGENVYRMQFIRKD